MRRHRGGGRNQVRRAGKSQARCRAGRSAGGLFGIGHRYVFFPSLACGKKQSGVRSTSASIQKESTSHLALRLRCPVGLRHRPGVRHAAHTRPGHHPGSRHPDQGRGQPRTGHQEQLCDQSSGSDDCVHHCRYSRRGLSGIPKKICQNRKLCV